MIKIKAQYFIFFFLFVFFTFYSQSFFLKPTITPPKTTVEPEIKKDSSFPNTPPKETEQIKKKEKIKKKLKIESKWSFDRFHQYSDVSCLGFDPDSDIVAAERRSCIFENICVEV